MLHITCSYTGWCKFSAGTIHFLCSKLPVTNERYTSSETVTSLNFLSPDDIMPFSNILTCITNRIRRQKKILGGREKQKKKAENRLLGMWMITGDYLRKYLSWVNKLEFSGRFTNQNSFFPILFVIRVCRISKKFVKLWSSAWIIGKNILSERKFKLDWQSVLELWQWQSEHSR